MAVNGWCAGGAVALLLLAASPAFGDNAPQPGTQIRAGAQAAKEKKWDACIEAYRAALEADDTPTTAGELGLCEEHAGRFADAYRHLHHALEKAPSPPTSEPWSRYQAAVTRVFKRIALVYVTSNPTKASVTLDGQGIGRADGRGIAVEPGTHTLVGHFDGYEDQAEPFTVSAGDVPNVHLELRPKPLPTVVAPPPPVQSAKPEHTVAPMPSAAPWYKPAWSPRGVLVPLAGISLGIALASTATMVGLEVDRSSMRATLGSESCALGAPSPPAICPALHQRVEERNVAIGVAIGSAALAGVLVGTSRLTYRFERDSQSAQLTPSVGPEGGGITLLGTW